MCATPADLVRDGGGAVSIPLELARTVKRACSLAEILEARAGDVAQEMGCGACSVFLLEPAVALRRARTAASTTGSRLFACVSVRLVGAGALGALAAGGGAELVAFVGASGRRAVGAADASRGRGDPR